MKLLALLLILFALVACGGGGGDPGASSGSGAVASGSLCGHDVGPNLIEGTVSKVHDGDTITVNGESIRLDGIAPMATQRAPLMASQTAPPRPP